MKKKQTDYASISAALVAELDRKGYRIMNKTELLRDLRWLVQGDNKVLQQYDPFTKKWRNIPDFHLPQFGT